MSLILVVGRNSDGDEEAGGLRYATLEQAAEKLAAAGGDRELGYALSPIEAAVVVRQAIKAGRNDVLVIPVDEPKTGARRSRRSELPSLEAHVGAVAWSYPGSRVEIVGSHANPNGGLSAVASLSSILSIVNGAGDDPALLEGTVERAFGGSADRFGQFVLALKSGLPEGTELALRGSAVQGYAFRTLEPFDADGPGTSDLDVVLLGSEAMAAWHPDAQVVPGVNTLPLADDSGWVAPSLDRARRAAQAIVDRPVSLQAMARWFLDLRAGVQSQPYVLLAT